MLVNMQENMTLYALSCKKTMPAQIQLIPLVRVLIDVKLIHSSVFKRNLLWVQRLAKAPAISRLSGQVMGAGRVREGGQGARWKQLTGVRWRAKILSLKA